MARRARVVAPGVAHHITQRGNNRQDVFDHDGDRTIFLDLLAGYAGRYGLSIWGYCLMNNHFHLVGVPEAADSLARTIGRLEADYARYLNVRRRTSGHLWQCRYYSIPMQEEYVWAALAYVERNPVRARLTETAWEYAWSSARVRVGMADAPAWLRLQEWGEIWTVQDWAQALEDRRSVDWVGKELRDATLSGRPLGADLTERLERERGVRLRQGQAGRPRKEPATAASA